MKRTVFRAVHVADVHRGPVLRLSAAPHHPGGRLLTTPQIIQRNLTTFKFFKTNLEKILNLDEENIECALSNKEFCFWQGKKAENV